MRLVRLAPTLLDLRMDPIEQAYAAPRSAIVVPGALQRPSTAWWLLFALVALTALVLGSLALRLVLTGSTTSPYRLVAFTFPLLLGLGAVGMYGYIRVRRIGPRWLWISHLAVSWPLMLITAGLQLTILVGQVRVGAVSGLWSALPQLVWIVGTLSLGLPLLVALGRYISRFPHLWARRPID